MRPEQRKSLEDLAQVVKSNYAKLQESQIVGRICLTSGRNVSSSLNGYKLMRQEGFIPDSFVEKDTAGVIDRLISKNPAILELMDRLGCVPMKTTKIRQDPRSPIYAAPRLREISEVIAGLKIAQF